MQHATMSVMGVYQYDNSVFDTMVIPSAMDKNLQIQHILMECAEMELLYNSPQIFKTMLGVWSNIKLLNWEKLYETTQFEYNPIENYDRKEDFNEDINTQETKDTEEKETETFNTTTTDTENVSRETTYTDTETNEENGSGTFNGEVDTTANTSGKNSGSQSETVLN